MDLKNRNDVDDKYKCSMGGYCDNWCEFYAKLHELEMSLPEFQKFKGMLGNINWLFEYELMDEKFEQKCEVLAYYAVFFIDADSSDVEAQKAYSAIQQLMMRKNSETAFVSAELRNLGKEYLESVVADKRFENYKLDYLELIKELPHVLDEHDAYLVSQISNFTDFQQMFTTLLDNEMKFDKVLDSKGEKHDLSFANFALFLQDNDRVLRENAWRTVQKTLSEFKLSLFSMIYNNLKIDDFGNKLCKYNGVLQARLDDFHLPRSVFDKIITMAKKFAPLCKVFYDTQAKLLHLEKIEPWDASLVLDEAPNKLSYEKGVELMKGAFDHLGDTYVKAFDDVVKNRWVDVFPNKNKNSAIYCGGAYRLHPMIHLNWNYEASDLLTFAHEFGHSVQFLISDNAQPYSLTDLPFAVVEVPSLTCESIMFLHLFNSTSDINMKISYLNSFIHTFMANVFGGCRLAEFEEWIRGCVQNGDILDVETASDKYLEIVKNYAALPVYDESKYSWLADQHIFVKFYNFTYSISMVVACYFANGIFEGDKEKLDNFYKFMQTGTSKYTLDSLLDCGVDLLDDKLYDDAFLVLENAISDYQKLVDEKLNCKN